MTSWPERMRADAALRAFVDGEIARAGIDVTALRVEHERDADAIAALRQEIAELKAQLKAQRK